MRPARTDAFEHIISELLTKRAELFGGERIRVRLAESKNAIGAINRVLGTLGYEPELPFLKIASVSKQLMTDAYAADLAEDEVGRTAASELT